ncbi:MAG: methyl-accepting chemotaxis protein [Pseudobdellovibrionaceae bacterium]
MGFSFFKSPSSNNVTVPDKIEIPDTTIRADVSSLLNDIALGHYDSALALLRAKDLGTLTASVSQIKTVMQNMLEGNVDLSIRINESSNIGAKLNRISLDINGRAQGMAAALEELSTSSSSIQNSTQNVFASAQDMKNLVATSISTSHDLETAIGHINSVVGQTQARVDDLVKSTEEIKRILGIIAAISNQTKLLSLNATIEAARAGEAGKGFAVVAGEVKKLAEETANSAEEIHDKVTALSNVTTEINSLMTSVTNAVHTGNSRIEESTSCIRSIDQKSDNVLEQMQEVFAIIKDQHAAVSEISQSVSSIAVMTQDSVALIGDTLDAIDATESSITKNLAFFATCELDHRTLHLAKSDHVVWKRKLSNMAAGRLKINPDELADHKNCRLGKWYYSDASLPYRNLPAFREIEQAHIDVHKHGISAARKYNDHDLDGALGEIDIVETSSQAVLEKLRILHSGA